MASLSRLTSAALLCAGALCLSLTGCVTTQTYTPNAQETDAVKFANEFRQAYNESSTGILTGGGLIGQLIAAGSNSSQQQMPSFIRHDGELQYVSEVWTPLRSEASTEFVRGMFDRICMNNNGILKDGWCIDRTGDRPLFWGATRGATKYRRACSGCSIRPIYVLQVVAIAPMTNNSRDWRKFAYESGWRTIKERQEESRFLLSSQGRGASVCHIVERGAHPKAGKVERGYIEDTNNGRLKIRIVATGALDSSFNDENAKLGDVARTEVMHERNIWAEPDNWFRCQ